MAKCDEGYLCDVCGQDVEGIRDSHLYLSYVIGELDPELLHTSQERHIRCNPVVAQFIVHDEFPPIVVDGEFGKHGLDPGYVADREQWVTQGFCRLLEVCGSDLAIIEYPLPEVIQRWSGHEDRG